MPNIAQVLKEEIARIARKQSRPEVAALKRTVARQRADIAALTRQVADLARQLSALRKQRPAPPELQAPAAVQRFRPKGLASHRRRLGLSAAELGRMFGVSGQTIYLWETGRARPRPAHMPAIAALRSLGRRQAATVLESLA
ncbi:MAG: helix-turn-helix domain-containing protein [Burkholderiales bacterium]|nr:MAG: helix-turn-helix domain-containing protein [Burkholderiales bacterium]